MRAADQARRARQTLGAHDRPWAQGTLCSDRTFSCRDREMGRQ